jgi:hypothetical protein
MDFEKGTGARIKLRRLTRQAGLAKQKVASNNFAHRRLFFKCRRKQMQPATGIKYPDLCALVVRKKLNVQKTLQEITVRVA